MDREILLLKLRNAIADKEWATACANMETARAGQWTCDWYQGVREADAELQDVIKQLEDINSRSCETCAREYGCSKVVVYREVVPYTQGTILGTTKFMEGVNFCSLYKPKEPK